MIDYVHLACDADIRWNAFIPMKWYRATVGDGEETFVHDKRGVRIRYYPERGRITLKGKILMLLHDTEVLNVDDIYGAGIERFLMEINDYLNNLFTRPILDIRDFQVMRIDYCFNVKTVHVRTYLDFLNTAFDRANHGSRINYAREKNLDGSVYVKTKSDYQQNERRNYVLNFYDKTDRLMKECEKGKKIKTADFKAAENVLRLEAQCGYQMVGLLCKRLRIENSFGRLFDFDVAVAAEGLVYSRVFGCGGEQDFYAYEAAKKRIPAKSEAAKKALFSASTNHSIQGEKYAHSRKVIKKAGVYPFCFLPKDCGLDCLENPLKLIRRKLEMMKSVA